MFIFFLDGRELMNKFINGYHLILIYITHTPHHKINIKTLTTTFLPIMPYSVGIGKHKKIATWNHRDHILPYPCDDMFNSWKDSHSNSQF